MKIYAALFPLFFASASAMATYKKTTPAKGASKGSRLAPSAPSNLRRRDLSSKGGKGGKEPDLYFHQPNGTVFVDTDPSNEQGDVPGLVAILHQPIYLEDRQTEIGTLTGSCTRIIAGEKWHCTGTYEMEGGSFTVSGPFYDGFGAVNAIAGGTETYRSVSGQAFYEVENDWNMVKVYFDKK